MDSSSRLAAGGQPRWPVRFSRLPVILPLTHKRIELGRGVWEKMRRRGLTRRDIRDVLALGIAVPVETIHGERRVAKVCDVRGRPHRLVYIERQQEITIVSFHALD